MSKLEERRAELISELAALDGEAQQAEQRGGEALALGQKVDKESAILQGLDARKRMMRAAIASVDAGLVRERKEAAEAQAVVNQKRAEELSRDGKALLVQLYKEIATASATCERLGPMDAELHELCTHGGARVELSRLGYPGDQVDAARSVMEGALKRSLPNKELIRLGLD